MSSLTIYNSLTRKKEVFEPLKPKEVCMYVCGPTVYGYLHVGNFRGSVFFNLVRNWLEKIGYKVTYVFNYTDVDDKIIEKAKEENMKPNELSEKYIKAFEEDYLRLKLRPHDHNPQVTHFMPLVVEFIEDLVKKKKAYTLETQHGLDVIFNVQSFKNYGKLSNKNLDELNEGVRIKANEKKKNPSDFVLWKAAKEGEPSWSSPWGEGRPGWHIECSTMSQALLGESMDIHGGGLDLIFPHHENEIAQSESRTSKTFVKYWMHHNMLDIKGEKMSKSLGNLITARSFFDVYHPEIYKYMILSSHYRSVIDFSQEQVETAIQRLARIYSALDVARRLLEKDRKEESGKFKDTLEKLSKECAHALNDDFNTVEFLARAFDSVREYNKMPILEKKKWAKTFLDWFSEKTQTTALFGENPGEFLKFLDDFLLKKKGIKRKEIDKLVSERTKARERKDYVTSDKIRDKLLSLEILVHDFEGKTSWEVKK